MAKIGTMPSKNFMWPDHSPSCPGRPGYKGICDCGAEKPSDVSKLRADRDELVAALELALFRCICFKHNVQCAGCQEDRALLARIKGAG